MIAIVLSTLFGILWGYAIGFKDIECKHYCKRKDCHKCAIEFLEEK